MTPKEKANELANKMFHGSLFDYQDDSEFRKEKKKAKQCALIAVDEIIKDREKLFEHYWIDLKYWQEVKQEIEKL